MSVIIEVNILLQICTEEKNSEQLDILFAVV